MYFLSKSSIILGIYLEPKWPLFLKVNPPKQGLFQSKQGSSKGPRYLKFAGDKFYKGLQKRDLRKFPWLGFPNFIQSSNKYLEPLGTQAVYKWLAINGMMIPNLYI